jgi:hypothetical protein
MSQRKERDHDLFSILQNLTCTTSTPGFENGLQPHKISLPSQGARFFRGNCLTNGLCAQLFAFFKCAQIRLRTAHFAEKIVQGGELHKAIVSFFLPHGGGGAVSIVVAGI